MAYCYPVNLKLSVLKYSKSRASWMILKATRIHRLHSQELAVRGKRWRKAENDRSGVPVPRSEKQKMFANGGAQKQLIR